MVSNSSLKSSVYLTVLFLWCGHFLIDMMLGVWPVYKSLAHLDLAKAGLVVAVGAFLGEGSQLIFGSLSDHGYRKPIILMGIFMGTASVFLPYSTAYPVLFTLYLLTCIGSGAFHPSAAGLANSLIPERRGVLMATFASGGSFGLAFSQIIFTSMYESVPDQIYLLAIPGICLVGCMWMLYRAPPTAANKEGHKINVKDFVALFKRSEMRYLYISQVANQSILWGLIFILPDALKTLGHFDWVCYGGGHMCLILGGAAMMIPSGYLADKYSARNVLLYSSLAACVIFYFILFSGGISMTLVLLALFSLGASLAIANPVAVALGVRYVPHQPGVVSAFLMGLVWCLSEALGPGGVGIVSTLFEDYAPVKALAILGGFFLINIYATIRLPKEAPAMAYANI